MVRIEHMPVNQMVVVDDSRTATETKQEEVNDAPFRPFIGTKLVEARPSLRGGYDVRYADGYQSWSPAEAFEEAYVEAVPENYYDSHGRFVGCWMKIGMDFMVEHVGADAVPAPQPTTESETPQPPMVEVTFDTESVPDGPLTPGMALPVKEVRIVPEEEVQAMKAEKPRRGRKGKTEEQQ